ncbi:MAG: metallophosphoesterase [Promethearchaeota archaeon]
MVRVACVSDVHSPKYLDLFKGALKKIEEISIDLFLFAGDMIYKGKVDELNELIVILEKSEIKFPIYSCFGNEEFDKLYDKIREIGKNKIIFLEDELVTFQKKGKSIGIIGTKGSLAEPTWWQARNIPNIRKLYRNKIKKIEQLTTQFNTDLRILLFHYAPTYLTVVGEPERSYPQMGTPAYEKIILNKNFKIDIVFHGHAHRGRKFALLNNRIPIHNVAIPLTKKITIIDLPKTPMRGSILSYLK